MALMMTAGSTPRSLLSCKIVFQTLIFMTWAFVVAPRGQAPDYSGIRLENQPSGGGASRGVASKSRASPRRL